MKRTCETAISRLLDGVLDGFKSELSWTWALGGHFDLGLRDLDWAANCVLRPFIFLIYSHGITVYHTASRIVENRLTFIWIARGLHLVIAEYVLEIKRFDAQGFLPFAKMV
jgi:hypothetical protein